MIDHTDVYAMFKHSYMDKSEGFTHFKVLRSNETVSLFFTLGKDEYFGTGESVLSACAKALCFEGVIEDFNEHALTSGHDAKAVAYVKTDTNYGVGIDQDITVASIKALINAVLI